MRGNPDRCIHTYMIPNLSNLSGLSLGVPIMLLIVCVCRFDMNSDTIFADLSAGRLGDIVNIGQSNVSLI